MKKNVIKALSLLLAAVLMLSLAACAPKGDSANSGKEEIILSYYTGEFGEEWIKELAERWSAANDEYYISVKGNLNLSGTTLADIKSGTKSDIVFSEDCAYSTIFSDEYLVDLSDVLDAKPDGESGKTVGEKIANAEVWMEMASKDGKTYMLPFNISPTGLIFDYDRFLENGWLFDKDGKLGGTNGVHPGKDGVEGTYDDGQPQNMDQFKAMCEKIRNSGTEVFLFMGVKAPDYVNNVAYAYLASYLGEEDFKVFYTHDSSGKEVELLDGTTASFTIEEGYKSFQMKGIDEMARFLSGYLCNLNYTGEASLNDVALTVDASHTQFITSGGPAFIIEGNWFEFGSYELINSLSAYDPEAKEYGTHNYRYMLVPASEEGRSVIHSQTGGGIIVPEKGDEKKTAAIKDFLVFMLSDENMGKVTQSCGMIWNYDYEISQEQYDAMTQFTRNTYEMVHDSANVLVRSGFIDMTSVPIYTYSAMPSYTYITLGLSTQTSVVTALVQDAKGNIQTFLDNIAAYNTPDRWAGWLEQAKSYGYYG